MELSGQLTVRLANGAEDIMGAQRLRYRVFVQEMGATPAKEDAALELERDSFDPHCDHLLLIDEALSDPLERVVGAYRLMRGSAAKRGIGFYSATEYDLSALENLAGETLELGRSCVARSYRNGLAMHLLWSGVGRYVTERQIGVLFGVASFHGTNVRALAQPLSYLHHKYLAPPGLRVRAQAEHFTPMDILPSQELDQRMALQKIPPLIKAYLRLGGCVGEGAFVDHAFNTTDVCLLMETQKMQAKYREMYTRPVKTT